MQTPTEITSRRKAETIKIAAVNIEPIEPTEATPHASMQSPLGGTFSWKIGPVTGVLIALSVVVALLSSFGSDQSILEWLYISSRPDAPLDEIRHGQVWRLLTPIFIHFGFIHLLFNMLWLKDLGTTIERRLSSRVLLSLVVVIGLLSNAGQFIFAGPFFGGMSGVVYGLLGFVWMKSRFDRASGFQLHQQTVIMMIAWFFLCITNVFGPVANFAHGFGLVTGMIWGFFAPRTRSTVTPAPPEDSGPINA